MRKVALLSICSLLLVVGCANKESKLLGTWAPEGDAAKSMTLELKADHKFSLSGGMGAVSGTWKLEESKVNLKIDNIAGKSPDEFLKTLPAAVVPMAKTQLAKPIEGTVAEDLKSMSLSQNGQAVTLKKNS